MSADKNPIEDAVEQALDAFVYAPIGLLFDGPARFPKLVRNGKTQVTNARMMGQFAVQMGRSELEKRAKELEIPVGELLRSLGIAPEPGTPAPTPTEASQRATREDTGASTSETTTSKKTTSKKTATKKRTTKKATSKKRSSKKATAKKRSSKKAAAKKAPAVASLPIPDYDSLSASQVVSRLQGLDAEALDAVRRYEAATRARKTVLSKVQQLQKR